MIYHGKAQKLTNDYCDILTLQKPILAFWSKNSMKKIFFIVIFTLLLTGCNLKTTMPAENYVKTELSFIHTVPGECSEIYVSVSTTPGTDVTVELSGPAVDSPNEQMKTTDSNGTAHFTFKIFKFGVYSAQIYTPASKTPTTNGITVK